MDAWDLNQRAILAVCPSDVCDTEGGAYQRITTYQFIRLAMPTFTDAKRERVRESLRDAGREFFGRYGIDKTAISELTESAGIGKGTFYQFYDSKEELYIDVIKQFLEEYIPRLLSNSFEAYDDPEKAIKAYLEESMDELNSNPFLRQVFLEDDVDQLLEQYSDDELSEGHERSVEFFLPYIEQWYDEGEVTGPDPETIAHALRLVTRLEFSKEQVGRERYPAVRETLISAVAAGITDGTDESQHTVDPHE